MPSVSDLGNIWQIIGELNVGAMQEEAALTPRLALIGAPDKTGPLQVRLQQGPRRAEHIVTAAPTFRLPLAPADVVELGNYDLRVLLLDDGVASGNEDLRALAMQPAPLLVVSPAAQQTALTVPGGPGQAADRGWKLPRVITCSLADDATVQKTLLPAIVDELPDRPMALGRAYPGLRPAACQKLIQETSIANATYAFGTGVAEMVPVLGIPLTMADIFILTKNQLILSYKISLAMGETAHLKDLAPKFASVVGLGFVWRTVARQLVALVPFGIVPKVAISYAGTYASGQAVYRWYVTGERLEGKDLKVVLRDAAMRGREQAELMVERFRKEKEPALIEGATGAEVVANGQPAAKKKGIQVPALKLKKKRELS